MAPRPYWKGHLRLSLVSCAVRLYNAISRSERIGLHLLNRKTKKRVQLRPHDAETGQELERSELVRGHELQKGRYVAVGEEELEALEAEPQKTIDLQRFIELSEVDTVYLDAPYYLAPDGKVADETFRVIREALQEERKAGIGRVILTNREHPVLLRPYDRGMLLTTLRPADQVRGAAPYFADIGEGVLDPEMVQLARRIIRQKTGPFDPKELARDRYQAALRELIARKAKGEKPVAAKAPAGGNVINLMDALRRSVEGEPRPEPPAGRRRGERQPPVRKPRSRGSR